MSIATIFTNGGSQAVRIPRAFRFATDRVTVESFRGGVLLMPIASKPKLADVFTQCDELSRGEKEFLSVRPGNGKPQRRRMFE